jgi:hypothetical protein
VVLRAREKANADPVPVARSRSVSTVWVDRAVRAEARVLHETRYPDRPCDQQWVDGFYAQALVEGVPGFGTFVGEAYSPEPGTSPFAIVDFSRALRGYVEGKLAEGEVEAALIRLESAASHEPELAKPPDL